MLPHYLLLLPSFLLLSKLAFLSPLVVAFWDSGVRGRAEVAWDFCNQYCELSRVQTNHAVCISWWMLYFRFNSLGQKWTFLRQVFQKMVNVALKSCETEKYMQLHFWENWSTLTLLDIWSLLKIVPLLFERVWESGQRWTETNVSDLRGERERKGGKEAGCPVGVQPYNCHTKVGLSEKGNKWNCGRNVNLDKPE